MLGSSSGLGIFSLDRSDRCWSGEHPSYLEVIFILFNVIVGGWWRPCAPRSHGRTGRSPGCPPASPRRPQTCSWQRRTTRSLCFVTIFLIGHRHINLYPPCQQGRVAGVLMAHDPAQVGGSPPGLSRLHLGQEKKIGSRKKEKRLHPVDRLHRPLVHHCVPSHRVLYTLRLAWRV